MEQMSEAEAKRHLAQYRVLTNDLRKRGQLIGCNRLLPAGTATTVRVRKGKMSITDGPFAETKELIGGYFLVVAKDRAEALRIAARIPGAQIGSVEVRPIADDPGTLRDRIERGEGKLKDLDMLSSISANIAGKTLCAFGDAAVTPVLTTLKHFKQEYEAHIKEGRCTIPADWRRRQSVGAHA